MNEHIYPIFDRLLQRDAKERMLDQRGWVIWFTGLSGSGKSTIAQHLEAKLFEEGFLTQVLDGDNIRSGLNNNLGFSVEDRQENIRRIAEVSKLFANCGIVTINSFISPTKAIRQFVKETIGADRYIEVFVNASLETCESRDVKGLYKKARSGEIKNFTGIDSPYEAPDNPDLEIQTDQLSVEEGVQKAFEFILPKITY
ncbi:MAG: adenylyl-sulfate kinase [Bacteroidota bacterium]